MSDFKRDHQAHRWVFDQDPLAYYLMMSAIYAENKKQREGLIELMTEEHRTLARKAKDGSWKRS